MYYEKYAVLGIAEKAADAVALSILWLLLCLPVITIVPASVALYYTVVKNLRRERGKLFRVFWASFRMNMKQGIMVNLLLCAYGIVTVNWLVFAGRFEVTSAQGLLYHIIARVFLLFGVLSQVYLCPVLSRFKGSVKSLVLGAVYLSYRYFLTSLCAVIVLAVFLYAVYVLPVSIVVAPALYMLVLSLFAERTMKKYMERMDAKDVDRWYLEG